MSPISTFLTEIMPVSLTTAKFIAPASFLFNLAAQAYALLSTPNMKDIHDANLSFFSPHPLFVATFFTTQLLLQLLWLTTLFRPTDQHHQTTTLSYIPTYTLSNLCLATWAYLWTTSHLTLAFSILALNTALQTLYLTIILPPNAPLLTHLVSKSATGIALLDLLHNLSAAFYRNALPSKPLKIATGLSFAALSGCSDWILGGCVVYDLAALSFGQRTYEQDWSRVLGGFALGCAAIVGVRNYLSPHQYGGRDDYKLAAQNEGEETT